LFEIDTKIEKEVKEVESEAEEEIGTTEETDKAGDSNNKAYLTQSYKVKMFQVLLDKIDDDLGSKFKGRANILNFTKEKV